MKEIGIVICNYNKEEYIINCIKSVFASSFQNFDIYVVDNASTDQSVKSIEREFGKEVNLIVNRENLGGSGGFNAGLRVVLQENYKYIMLLDNDIILDKHAIGELYNFLENNSEVGMVGSKVYFMDQPDRIWGYGGNISFEKFIQQDNYKNMVDSEIIPEIIYCDYVAACSMLVRTDAVKNVGIMPEENFIYWDDMEWGYRFNNSGYKVAVYGKSIIWHKAGGRNAGNTFINYYMWRNRIRFFLKYLTEGQKKKFSEVILSEMFKLVYSCNLKGELNIVKSVMYAFDDAIHGVDGKADEYKILPRNNYIDRVENAIRKSESVLILFNSNFESLGNIIKKIKTITNNICITISVTDPNLYNEVKKQFNVCKVVKKYKPENYSSHLIMCEHIFDISQNEKDNYIDGWCNIVTTEEDFNYCKSFDAMRKLFVLYNEGLIINARF